MTPSNTDTELRTETITRQSYSDKRDTFAVTVTLGAETFFSDYGRLALLAMTALNGVSDDFDSVGPFGMVRRTVEDDGVVLSLAGPANAFVLSEQCDMVPAVLAMAVECAARILLRNVRSAQAAA